MPSAEQAACQARLDAEKQEQERLAQEAEASRHLCPVHAARGSRPMR